MMRFFRNITIRSRLVILAAVLCLFTASTSFVGYVRLNDAAEDMENMYHNGVLAVQWMNDARANLNRIRGNLFLMMLSSDEALKNSLSEQIRDRRRANDENLANFRKLDLDDFEIKRFEDIIKNLENFRAGTQEVIALSLKNQNQEAMAAFSQRAEKPLNDLLDAQTALANYAIEWCKNTNAANAADMARARMFLLVFAVSAVILGTLLTVIIIRSVTRPINAVGEILRTRASLDFRSDNSKAWLMNYEKNEIAAMVGSLATMEKAVTGMVASIAGASAKLGAASEEFSALAEESNAGVEESRAGVDDVSSQMENLAAASEEINASVEEVASGAQSSAQKSTEMAGEVEQARAAGEEGTKAVANVVRSVARVAEDAGKSAREVRGLGDRAREIQNFVSQIGGIADQTNLLALNAAIEAARAGEAGRGFAVVAEEVRKLAEESNEAAKKIEELAGIITRDLDAVVASSESNVKDSRESSRLAEETRATIGQMMEALAHISAATQDLAAVSEEQAASSEEIASAVQNIASRVGAAASSSEIVRGQMGEVATSAERVARGSEELAGLSLDLRNLVEQFKIDGDTAAGGLVPVQGKPARDKLVRGRK